jgi:HemY protein
LRKLLLILIFLTMAIGIGLVVRQHPGFVLIAYDVWTIEMPLWFFVLASIFTFFIVYFVIKFIYNTLYLGEFFAKYWLKWQQQCADKKAYYAGLKNKYLAEQQWQALRELLPRLKKYSVENPQALQKTELSLYQGLLEQAVAQKELTALQNLWRHIPKSLRKHHTLLTIYLRGMCELDARTAQAELTQLLKKQYDQCWLALYYRLDITYGVKELKWAESLLKRYPATPQLYNLAAKVALQCELWGKAHTWLEKSVALQPQQAQAYLLLARLAEQLGHSQEAYLHYKTFAEATQAQH